MSFLRRQVITAALTANAIRPVPGFRAGIPAFVAGWLTGELAPHLLALTAADVATHLTERRRDVRGLAVAAVGAAGLVFLIDQSRRVGTNAEDALVEGIGEHYLDKLDTPPSASDRAVPWRSLVNPFRDTSTGVRVERNIAYGDAGKRNLLDVYAPVPGPDGPVTKAPVLLQVHGGGWSIGNKDQQALPLMRHLAAKGWVCVSINYRLSPRNAFPAHVIDVKRSIAWIRENIASYGGDPDYIAITGGSAGGHLCTLAALTPDDPDWQPGFEHADTSVKVAVPHYGVYDFSGESGLRSARQMRDSFLGPTVLRKKFSRDPAAFEKATPLLRITPEAPDFFILHGTRDTMVPIGQAREFVKRLRATSKQTVVYAELPGAQHAFDIFPSIRSAQIVRAVDRYLHWHWNTWRAGLDHEDQMIDSSPS
jgi:acetyl esterase/lipase